MKKLNKNIIALIVAVVMALLCAILLKLMIDKKISSSLEQDTISYVVANADLSSGILIDPFDSGSFAVRNDIPANLAQSNAITPDDAESILGALLIANMKRGDILTWQMIDTDERRQLASRLASGRRALTIPVDDQSSISSMLKPNDRIDLLLSYNKSGLMVAAPLLQNVRVIATGDNVNTSQSPTHDSMNSYTNITLDLSIEDVSRVTMALDLGRLSAVLRNPDDLTYTSKVISLETLQEELRLRTTGISEQLSQPEPDWLALYEEQLRADMARTQNEDTAPNPNESKDNTSKIKVIYGNKPISVQQ